jgi:protein-tyrosine kinase
MSRLDAALRRAGALPDTPAPDLPRIVPRWDERTPGEAAPLVAPPTIAAPKPAPVIAAPAIAAPSVAAPIATPALVTPIVPRRTATVARSPAAVGPDIDEYNDGRSYVDEKLVTMRNVTQSTVEQYRKLAATLHHAQAERELKVVMISSAVSGDGKTLTSTNLALTLSESYRRRVLLIDADLRRPSVHRVFKVRNESGLTDSLTAAADRRLPIVEASPHLSLLLAGRPDSDPMSGLTSGRMRRLITEAKANFDWVLIDTPPLVLLPDANLLAAMVDGAILVIGAGKTPYKLITRAIDAVGRGRILGVVLNRVDQAHVPGGYGYGYGYGYFAPRGGAQ